MSMALALALNVLCVYVGCILAMLTYDYLDGGFDSDPDPLPHEQRRHRN